MSGLDRVDTSQGYHQGNRTSDLTDISVLSVNAGDLALLREAISRWRLFLMGLFPPPSTRDLDEERLDQMSMEDTERYLDVRVQAFRCIGAVQDSILERELEALLNDIRKETYHYVTGILPDLCENSRTLLATALRNEHGEADEPVESDDSGWVSLHDLDDSVEYKDCLISQRKQLKSEMVRHRSRMLHQFSRLDQLIRRVFRPAG